MATVGDSNDNILIGDETVRESFDWQGQSNADLQNGFTQNTGNVDVTFSSPTETGISLRVDNTSTIFTGGIDDGGQGIDTNSSMISTTANTSSLGQYVWDFSQPVSNVTFNVTDLDGTEVVTFRAFDADGNQIDVNLTPGTNVSTSDTDAFAGDDTATGSGSGDLDSASQAVTVSIPGSVARIEMDHTLVSGANIGVGVSQMFFDAQIVDDTIFGGAGNDTISGLSGNDTVLGEVGNDSISGGTGNDTLDGGAGSDTIDGGAGDDTIIADSGTVPFAGSELLSNGTFDGNLNDWTVLNPSGGQAPVYSIDFDAVRLNSSDEAAGNDGIEQSFATTSGDVYSASVDLSQNGVIAGDHTVVVEVLDSNGAVVATETVVVSLRESETVDLSFTAADSSHTLRITNPSSTETVGTDVVITGASVVQTAEPAPGGDDVIDGGTGDDSIEAGEGSDTILLTDAFGNDTIEGGEDPDGLEVDVLDASGVTTGGVTVTFTGDEAGTVTDGTGTATFSDIEQLDLTDQADTVDGSAATSPITIDGGGGADSITGGSGADVLSGGDGNDSLDGGDGNDSIDGGLGNDSVAGGLGTDTVSGGDGNDSLDGGDGDDLIYGGDGDDAVLAADSDIIYGGAGSDTISFNAAEIEDGDVINIFAGDDGGAETDALDLTGSRIVSTNAVPDGTDTDSKSGTLVLEDADGDQFTVNFSQVEVVCIAAGTLIETADGARPVEDLVQGDVVMTADHGAQPLQWIGATEVTAAQLAENPKLAPVRIRAGALGPNTPDRDLLVSRQHRILVRSRIAERMFGAKEVLVPAIKLVDVPGVEVATDVPSVRYFHLLCDQHEILFANGTEAESLYLGPEARKMLPEEAIEEIATLFPEVFEMAWEPLRCRPFVTGRRAARLTERHRRNARAFA